jgi:hypothetical protein
MDGARPVILFVDLEKGFNERIGVELFFELEHKFTLLDWIKRYRE